MWLLLEPIDVWLFRDGRSFDAFADHRVQSVFPPYPSVIQGGIRSHYLVLRSIDLDDRSRIAEAVGTAEDFKTLRLRGPFLAKRSRGVLVRYYPVPADACSVGDSVVRPASSPQPLPPSTRTSAPTPMLLGLGKMDRARKGLPGLWVDEQTLEVYLAGNEVRATREVSLFRRESRFGISMNRATYTPREEALYEAEFIRPCDGVGLLVEMEGYAGWPDSGLLRLGGEGRGARFTVSDTVTPWPSPPEPLPCRFKLFFATPTYFDGGWQPSAGDWSRFFEGSVKLLAAAVPRFESVGGYDWAKDPQGAHKPARRYVAAGSVYYFQCEGEARLKPGLVQGAVTDYGAEIGFGQIMIREW